MNSTPKSVLLFQREYEAILTWKWYGWVRGVLTSTMVPSKPSIHEVSGLYGGGPYVREWGKERRNWEGERDRGHGERDRVSRVCVWSLKTIPSLFPNHINYNPILLQLKIFPKVEIYEFSPNNASHTHTLIPVKGNSIISRPWNKESRNGLWQIKS